MKNNFFKIFIFSAIAGLFTYIFTYKLGAGEFLFIGDQYLKLSYKETLQSAFSLVKSNTLGAQNGWSTAIHFFDTLYFLAAYALGLPIQWVERLLFFTILALTLNLSSLGLNKIAALIFGKSLKTGVQIALVLWYSFNPYTLSLWHGGVYNIGAALTYSLAPLLFFYFHKAIFGKTDMKAVFLLSMIAFFSTFTFWLFAPMVLFLILYAGSYMLFFKVDIKTVLKNLGLGLIFYSLISGFVIYAILHEYINVLSGEYFTNGATFGNMQGGIGYQMELFFSWGIYTFWSPRSLYPFYKYYLSVPYIVGLLVLYITVFANAFKLQVITHRDRITRFINMFMLLFFTFIFLAKGDQKPFGGLFIFLYNHVPLFSIFRTPDIRFGFIIILLLTVGLIYASTRIKPQSFIARLIIIILLLGYPFFSGAATQGENVSNIFFDRIVRIPPAYQELANYLNKDNGMEYILPVPGIEYGHYLLDQSGDRHIGQDILSKLVTRPFLYTSPDTTTHRKTINELVQDIKRGDFKKITKLPIKYILVREDIECSDCFQLQLTNSDKYMSRVFKNKLFTLYEINNYTHLTYPSTELESSSAFLYTLRSNEFYKSRKIIFERKFSENWALFPPALKHKASKNKTNEWILRNDSNSVYLIYYKPQIWYYLLLLVSGFTMTVLIKRLFGK